MGGAVERPHDIRLDQRTRGRGVEIPDLGQVEQGGVVDQPVDAAVAFDAGVDQPFRLVPLADVGDAHHRRAADRANRRGGLLGEIDVDIVDHHPGTLARAAFDAGPADALARAGDDDGFAIQHAHD